MRIDQTDANEDVDMQGNNNNNNSNESESKNDSDNRLSQSNMDLIYCDMKGKMSMKTLSKILEKSQFACYTMQFFIKKHFVEAFKAMPTIYVATDD